MSAMASQITGVSIVYSTVCSGADHRKYQSSASLAFVRGIHRWPVNPPHKGPVTRKMFPFDDVIMTLPPTVTIGQRDPGMAFCIGQWKEVPVTFFLSATVTVVIYHQRPRVRCVRSYGHGELLYKSSLIISPRKYITRTVSCANVVNWLFISVGYLVRISNQFELHCVPSVVPCSGSVCLRMSWTLVMTWMLNETLSFVRLYPIALYW